MHCVKYLFKIMLVLSIGFLFNNFVRAQSVDEIVAKFEKRTFNYLTTTLPYRLFIPEKYNPSELYPLVLCLHGSGERGTDNEIHIRLHRLATSWADTMNQNKWPCFVLAPQCPDFQEWDSYKLLALNILIDSLKNQFNIDTNRLYITGLSMGGFGTWDMIAAYPNRFAAAIPMSGGGDTSKVPLFKNVPVWNFHGRLDNAVPVKYSREMNDAYSRYGVYVVQAASIPENILDFFISIGAKHLYTEYPNGDHVIWSESYDYPKLFPWVFSQNKAIVNIEDQPDEIPNSYGLNQNYPNPFNPSTKISWQSPVSSHQTVKVFDVLGNAITTLVDEYKPAGTYEINWNAANLPSGVYFYQLKVGNFIETKKMLLVK